MDFGFEKHARIFAWIALALLFIGPIWVVWGLVGIWYTHHAKTEWLPTAGQIVSFSFAVESSISSETAARSFEIYPDFNYEYFFEGKKFSKKCCHYSFFDNLWQIDRLGTIYYTEAFGDDLTLAYRELINHKEGEVPSSARPLQEKYGVGKTIPIFVNPRAPQESMFIKIAENNASFYGMVIFGLAFSLSGYFLRKKIRAYLKNKNDDGK